MSSIRGDKAWVLVSFIIRNGNQRIRVRLYPGIRDTRKGRRFSGDQGDTCADRGPAVGRTSAVLSVHGTRAVPARDSGARRDYVPASLGTVSRVSEEYERQGYRALL